MPAALSGSTANLPTSKAAMVPYRSRLKERWAAMTAEEVLPSFEALTPTTGTVYVINPSRTSRIGGHTFNSIHTAASKVEFFTITSWMKRIFKDWYSRSSGWKLRLSSHVNNSTLKSRMRVTELHKLAIWRSWLILIRLAVAGISGIDDNFDSKSRPLFWRFHYYKNIFIFGLPFAHRACTACVHCPNDPSAGYLLSATPSLNCLF